MLGHAHVNGVGVTTLYINRRGPGRPTALASLAQWTGPYRVLIPRTGHSMNESMNHSLFINDTAPEGNTAMPLFNMTSPSDTSNTTIYTTPGRSGGVVMAFPWDNPENIVQQEVSDSFEYGFQCVVFPILTLFGLTGNILSLIVLTRKQMHRSTTSIVLIGLATSDTCFLVTNMIRKSKCIISQVDELTAELWNAVSFRYVFYLKLVFSRISTLLVVVICFERFLAVAMPLKIKSIVTRTRMILVVVGCYLFTFLGIGGIPFQYTWRYLRGNPVIWPTEFANENQDSLKVYNEYFLPVVFRYIPVAIVVILTILIIVLLQRSQQFKKNTAKGSSTSDEQRKITRMLLTVAVIYLVCLIPGDAVLIAAEIDKKFRFFGNYHNLFLIVSDISLLFELFNSSINFIIYMVLNKNFYSVYVSLFCGSCVGFLQDRRQGMVDKEKKSKKDISSGQSSSDTKMTLGDANTSQNEGSDIGVVEGHTNTAFEE